MVDSASVNGLFSTPLVLAVAGALAALFLVLVLMAVRRAAHGGGGTRLLIPFFAVLVCALAMIGIMERLAMNERVAEQRDFRQRESQLSLSAIQPGSPLGCLDGVAG